MEVKVSLKQLAPGLFLTAFALTVNAAEIPINMNSPASEYFTRDIKSFVLAENDASVVKPKNNITPVAPAAEVEPPLFSGRNVHKYLGLSTIALAGLTAITNPGEGENKPANAPRDVNGTHAQLAKATVAMAAATIATGLVVHWDDFSFEDGITDPDNLHILLGVTGAALMAYAVQKSASQSTGTVSHAGIAEAGALGMLVAIKLTW